MTSQNSLFIFGYGFTSHHLASLIRNKSDHLPIVATSRKVERIEKMHALDITPISLTGEHDEDKITPHLEKITHLLISAGPSENGDPFLNQFEALLKKMPHLKWIGYLSTTAVYGNHDGAWVDEDSALNAGLERGKWRIAAENKWLSIGRNTKIPTHIFRLSGIFGRGRNAFTTIEKGKAKRVIKKGQLFNRIHADDIAQTVYASMYNPYHDGDYTRIYNVADDEAAPPQDVIAYACSLMGISPPPEVQFEEANMSAMARSFYSESKKVSNDRIKQELGITLLYPNYKQTLKQMWEEDDWR